MQSTQPPPYRPRLKEQAGWAGGRGLGAAHGSCLPTHLPAGFPHLPSLAGSASLGAPGPHFPSKSSLRPQPGSGLITRQ